MKQGLKRIEATLNELGTRKPTSQSQPSGSRQSSYSFIISSSAKEDATPALTRSDSAQKTQTESTLFPQNLSVQTFPAQENGKSPSLPKFKSPSFSSHRHGANPALAINLLKEIEANVATWQTELQLILRQIQDIYLEGPIVDGWLESHAREPEEGGSETARHAKVDRLMDYVEEISTSEGKVTCESPRAGYRLCGMDETGKVWSRPCPPEQVPTLSVAIARYQKLRQLLGRKQYLETRLNQLAETLVVLHGHIQS